MDVAIVISSSLCWPVRRWAPSCTQRHSFTWEDSILLRIVPSQNQRLSMPDPMLLRNWAKKYRLYFKLINILRVFSTTNVPSERCCNILQQRRRPGSVDHYGNVYGVMSVDKKIVANHVVKYTVSTVTSSWIIPIFFSSSRTSNIRWLGTTIGDTTPTSLVLLYIGLSMGLIYGFTY